jgi:fumarylacetoacetate (FAA) hydrolase
LQAALDDWKFCEARLRELSEALERDQIPHFPFVESACDAPLPRAYQWADGSAYVNHVDLLRRSRGSALPDSFWTDPLLYQGGSDRFCAPHEPIVVRELAWGVDFEAEIAVISDDVPLGTTVDAAADHIKLYVLVNDVSLRHLIPAELDKGFGFFVGKPATSLSPLAITPDEFGPLLTDHRISATLCVDFNGKPFGRARPDIDQVFTFPDLIAHAAQTRSLGAGTIIGGGTVSNRLDGGPGRPLDEGGVGYSCIAELRAVEAIRSGRPTTDFMAAGDRVSIEMLDENGQSLFGRIEQTLELI